MDERRELAGKKPVGAERDTEVLKGKASLSEMGEAKDGLLRILRYTSKEDRGFGCINFKARRLPKNCKLLEEDVNRGHVTTAKQENVISKTKMTDSQSLTFGMEIETRMLGGAF